MANTQAQFGFQQYGYLSGSGVDYQQSSYLIQKTYASAIYFGDPVIKSASTQYIKPATGTGNLTTLTGIFVGCSFQPTGGGATQWSPYWPGNTALADATAYVIDAPNATFKAAALLTAIPATAIGANIGFSTGAGGTTLGGGFSTYVLDQSTITTGATAPFTIIDLFPGAGNGSDASSNYNWAIVGFNNQRFRNTTGVA